MRFGTVPTETAGGAILAHSVSIPGRRLKKGRVLGPEDLSDLQAAGIARITVARPDPGDVSEDEAAGRIGQAIADGGDGLMVSSPFTGRANLFADHAGVLVLDETLIDGVNQIDEAITLATLPPFAWVQPRQMLGTVKIIPYGVDGRAVAAAEAALAGRRVMQVHAPMVQHIHLILTRTHGMADKLIDKGGEAVRRRLTALGIHNCRVSTVDHQIEPIAAVIDGQVDLTLILTGSATSDRGDVGPAALEAAGGRLERFGMPVDPGNLLFVGQYGKMPVVGLPGCIRSPKLNGADWVLQRLICGLPVSGETIGAMGVGGLLKEISSRPEPRAGGASAPMRPRIAAILLAGGASRRMRGRDKLLEQVDGHPLLSHVAQRLLESKVDHVVCVLPADDQKRRAIVSGLDVHVLDCPQAADGMAHSLACGISALSEQIDAAIVVLADMPEIKADHINRMIAAFDPGEGRAIVRACSAEGKPGHPVLFGRRFFEALSALEGDAGARSVLAEHPEYVVDLMLPGEAALTDLDTPEAWQAWRSVRDQQ